jgi:muramidase (phage lysozyme)
MPIPWQEGACSTAAGRYQLLSTTWEEWATVAGLDSRNFAPDRQDLAVYHYLSRLGLQSYLQNNQAKRAFCQLGRASVWTSVPCGKERNRHTAGVLSYYRYFLAQESLGIEHPRGRAAVIENGELLKNK